MNDSSSYIFRYKLLHVLEFDANRRRMSVILESPSGTASFSIVEMTPMLRNKSQDIFQVIDGSWGNIDCCHFFFSDIWNIRMMIMKRNPFILYGMLSWLMPTLFCFDSTRRWQSAVHQGSRVGRSSFRHERWDRKDENSRRWVCLGELWKVSCDNCHIDTKGGEQCYAALCTSNEIKVWTVSQVYSPLPIFLSFSPSPPQRGLRTLVVACRHFSPQEYIEVDKHLNSARTALQQREERLQQAFGYVEKNLQVLGATGVEDKYGFLINLTNWRISKCLI